MNKQLKLGGDKVKTAYWSIVSRLVQQIQQ